MFVDRHFYLGFIFLFSSNCLPYLTHLGVEQSRILWNRQPIPKLLSDPKTPTETREKLRLVREVREFGIQQLGLSPDSGFETFVALDREEIGWNVSGCLPLAFESYTWWFPIAGRVPYKGFFSYEKAKLEEEELQKKGYETRVRATGGYSTLGYFSDPIFSTQLKSPNLAIAELVLHEMSHSTVYIPGDSIFNESYASFVEEKGTELFLNQTNLISQSDFDLYRKNKKQNLQSKQILVRYALILKELYESNKSVEEKISKKQKILQDFQETVLKEIPFNESQKKKFLAKQWNNEDFIGYLRYHSGTGSFEKELEECKGNFSCFHAKMRSLQGWELQKRKEYLGL